MNQEYIRMTHPYIILQAIIALSRLHQCNNL